MLTCRDMFTTLNIDSGELRPCCSGLCKFSLDHDNERFSKTIYLRYLEMMQKRFREGHPTCDPSCGKLVEVPDDSLTPFPDQLSFRRVLINHHRNYCNCRCTYCPFWDVTPKPRLSSVALLLRNLFEQRVIADDCTFAWGGGESTLLKEFDEQVIMLSDRGYRQFIHTNAIRFSPAIAEVLRRGQAVVNVSLDSGDAQSYAGIKGINAWERVLENLARYRACLAQPEALEIKYLLNRDTAVPRRIRDFFAVCRLLDIKKVLYSFDINDLPWERYIPFAQLIMQEAKESGMACAPFRS